METINTNTRTHTERQRQTQREYIQNLHVEYYREIYLFCCTKLNSRWKLEVSIKLDTLNLEEEKVGVTLELIDTRKYFLT